MRIEYDDDVLNIISSVNDELKKYHLKFQIEDGDKDGFELFELVRIKKKFIINAKPFELHANFLSYDNLVDLAEKSGYPTIACSVPGLDGFTVVPGEYIELKDGMIFTVMHTNNA